MPETTQSDGVKTPVMRQAGHKPGHAIGGQENESQRNALDGHGRSAGLCIKHGWFTRGDCKAYDKLLKMPYDAKGKLRNITTTILCNMAQAIMQYSDPETYEILEFEGILYCLSEICHTCFSVED